MSADNSDSQLVKAYAAQGSEAAFRALVARHVNMVFATALRQVGDPGASEEITQNVFVTLARKAPRLGGVETLAGWLYRATILEAKARMRQEFRRVRREETAAQLATLQREGASPFDVFLPLLDEALLHLRDGDRIALLLRFFENRSLRDVGQALGVDEDAARKRVSRALDRVTEFFRKRGFVVPAGMGSAALLQYAAQSAPTGLATSATSAGLAVGAAVTGLLWFHFLALTKTQTMAACAVLAALPITWQWQSQSRTQRALVQQTVQLNAARQEVSDLNLEIQSWQTALTRARADRTQAENRLATLTAGRAGQAAVATAAYAWDDASPLARVPKALLARVRYDSFADVNGVLSRQIKALLQMTDDEALRVESAGRQFLVEFRNAEAAKLRLVPPNREELGQRAPEDVRVFQVPDLRAEFVQLREAMFSELRSVLGEQRTELFKHGLSDRLPLADNWRSFSSSHAAIPTAKRIAFEKPAAPAPYIRGYVWFKYPGGASGGMRFDYPPEPYRGLVADWIALGDQLQQAAKQKLNPP